MNRWPTRIFAVFSMLWGLLILGVLAFAWIARDYMLSPETGWQQALVENAMIIGGGVFIWFGVYLLMQWFEERS